MKREVAENLLTLGGLGPRLEDLLGQSDDPARRVFLLAQALHNLWPSAALTLCSLPCEGDLCLAVVDATGEPRPGWAKLLRSELGAGGHLPAALDLKGWTLALEPLATPESGGTLGLALPENETAEQTAGLALLAVVAQQLGLRLELQAQELKIRVLQKELQTQTSLANLGELARPVTHEFNNFLNVLLLHMAVLEMELPPKQRQEVAEIQRQGKAITAVVRQFQRHRQQEQAASETVDLNQVVREAMAAITAGPKVRLHLAPNLPHVAGPDADFRRLCQFLLTNAAAVVGPRDGDITLHTETAAGKVLLRLEDNGPAVPEDLLHHLFEVNHTVREGTCALELAACKSLTRRLRGGIQAENRPEGGLTIVADFPAVPS